MKGERNKPSVCFCLSPLNQTYRIHLSSISNRGIRLVLECSQFGMLLFPLGNLSHTSILYYTILSVKMVFELYSIRKNRNEHYVS
jgi:hypothetical protein